MIYRILNTILLLLFLSEIGYSQQQVVDIGSAPNAGDGDPLRTAFDKLNDNDTELYQGQAVVVAASDAPGNWAKIATYIADGTADEATIQSAVDSLPAAGGAVELTPGTFTFAEASSVTVPSNVRITGQGYNTHIIVSPAEVNPDKQAFRVVGETDINTSPVENVIIEKIRFTSLGQAGSIRFLYAKKCIVRDTWHTIPNGYPYFGQESQISVRECQDCIIENNFFDAQPSTLVSITSVDDTANTLTASSVVDIENNSRILVIGNDLPEPLTSGERYFVQNLSGSSFQVSIEEASAAIDLTDAGSGTIQYKAAASWGLGLNTQQSYGCTYRNLRGNRVRSVFDCWGARDCVIDGVWGYDCEEGIDLGNISHCRFTNINLYRCEENAITLKEETGTVGTVPTDYQPYVYGSQYNVFDGLNIRDFRSYGIGFSAANIANPQPLDFNKITNFLIASSYEARVGQTNAQAAIRINASGTTGQNLYNTGTQVTNGRIDMAYGDGIKHASLHSGVFANLLVEVDGGAELGDACIEFLGSTNQSTHVGQSNSWANVHCKKNDITLSFSNRNTNIMHEEGLHMSNCTFEGGWTGLDANAIVRSTFDNITVRDVGGHGARFQWTVDRTASGGDVDLQFTNCSILNANINGGSRGSFLFIADGNVQASATNIRINGLAISDTQGSPTAQDITWTLNNGGIFNRVRRTDNWLYNQQVTLSLPATGVGHTLNGIGSESANAETPTTASWQAGDIVNFTDSGDASGNGLYMLMPNGTTWTQLN